MDRCGSVVVPKDKKGDRSSYENHSKYSLVEISSELLAGIILRRVSCTPDRCVRDNQDGFRPGRACTDLIVTSERMLEHRHVFRRLTISIIDLKLAFYLVIRAVLSPNDVSEKFISLVHYLCAKRQIGFRACGNRSRESTKGIGVRQSCPLLFFLSTLSLNWSRR